MASDWVVWTFISNIAIRGETLFAFEAKRLRVLYPGGKRSTEYPTYVGNAGMMAFLVEQYSKGLPAAGMLAYVMDGRHR